MQVILDSSFARPGSAPIWGGKKGEFRDWIRTLCEYSLESLNLVAFTKPNKHKMRSKGFARTSPVLFLTTFATVGKKISDFYKVLSFRFSQHDLNVTQIPNTSSSAGSHSPPSPSDMTATIAGNDARTSEVDQFSVVTAQPKLGTWFIVTSPVEGTKFLIFQILAHVAIDLHSSLYIINLPHSCRGIKLHRYLFFVCCNPTLFSY